MKTILIALATLAVAAPAANATPVGFAPDGALTVTAGPESNNLAIQSDDDSSRVRIYEGKPGLTVTAPPQCVQMADDMVYCPMPAAGVRVALGGGHDRGYVSFDLADVPMSISGGDGNDVLQASLDGQPTTL